MKPVARVGDLCGGDIVTGANTVLVNGRPAGHITSQVAPHPFGDSVHVTTIVTGSSSVFAEGQPLAGIGDQAGCGVHKVTTSSNNVLRGG